MTRAVLSIGSNLGDRLAQLRSVVDGLGERVRAVSAVYSTAPWGGVEQDDYLNAIVLVDDPEFSCLDWLRAGQRLEQAADRVREVRWGARTLDVDVVWCADGARPIRSADPELTLPHPQAQHRAFVLVPWLEVDPAAELELDGVAHPVRELLRGLDPAERDGVRRTEHLLATTTRGDEPCNTN
ncbi:2-amino-4-hydroxy-6-hydroxymethyldihydropteridine diphosphokinase [Nocardia sp. NPDC050712]|uniref:2-amino-4-hydroxy-6- hydroxymethyldihydropteridine diphosphokinase n=1 Tax=Nocardia sp. NPDC050712 TaxID=3155518 RepID=UPI0033D9822D